jgi:hypothetical protein
LVFPAVGEVGKFDKKGVKRRSAEGKSRRDTGPKFSHPKPMSRPETLKGDVAFQVFHKSPDSV